MKYLFALLTLLLTSCDHEVIKISEASPQGAVIKYYEAARQSDVEKANSYLSSYDHKKMERFPENRTNRIEYVKKYLITPRIDAVQTNGRFSAVAIVYQDPQSRNGADRMEYILLVNEMARWKLVMTSRPYIDPADWNISAAERHVIQGFEAWYEKRKKRLNPAGAAPVKAFDDAMIRDTAVLEKQLDAGLDPNSRTLDNHDEPLLWRAVRLRAALAVALLLNRGARVDEKSINFKKTALFQAAYDGSLEIARLLLDKGADPNALDMYDNNPLREAILAKRPDMVRLLRRHGANPNQRNKDGETMTDIATKYGTPIIQSILAEKDGA